MVAAVFRCILESAYELHDSVFFKNLGTVLLYAVVVSAFSNCQRLSIHNLV